MTECIDILVRVRYMFFSFFEKIAHAQVRWTAAPFNYLFYFYCFYLPIAC